MSQPAVSRFATALGFAGYPALRDALRLIVLGSVAESPQQVRRNELQAAIATEEANLATLHELAADPERFAALGRELAASPCLPVLGLRMSDPVAYYFIYGARRIHPDVRFVDSAGSAAFDLLLQSRQAGARWLLAFTLPRYAAEAITVLDEAKRLGYRVALVTDSRLAPLGRERRRRLPDPCRFAAGLRLARRAAGPRGPAGTGDRGRRAGPHPTAPRGARGPQRATRLLPALIPG